MGRRLAALLVERGHTVRALVRPGSAGRLPPGCQIVTGDALRGLTYAAQIAPADTFVHLVGVAHPSPSKAADFLRVDLASVEHAIPAAVTAGIAHFIYVSVAQPAPVMLAYVAARARAESLIRESGLPHTILRPWYVVGPGRWWPLALLPAYWAAGLLPPTRAGARRRGLVTLGQMLRALVFAVEHPSHGARILGVPEIRGLAW